MGGGWVRSKLEFRGWGKKHNLEVFKRELIRVDTEAHYLAK